MREIADQTASVTPWVAVNCLDPGFAHTGLTRNARGSTKAIMAIMRACLAWTAEEGSRTLLHAVSQGPESHGVYISGCKIQKCVDFQHIYCLFANFKLAILWTPRC